MSHLLLDTQVVIWWDNGSKALGKTTLKAIRAAENVYVSATSEWELTIKAAAGKLLLRRSVLDAAVESGFVPIGISFEHAQRVGALKPVHKDPFDRLLVATAAVENLTLVSSDIVLAQYPIDFIDARI